MVEQQFQECSHKQRVLVCIYSSNRLCLLTCADWELHQQLLVEETATIRQRLDIPLGCVALPGVNSGACQLVVSYSSMSIRWWRVSLTTCRLLSHTVLSSPAAHVAALEWPTNPNLSVSSSASGLRPVQSVTAARSPSHRTSMSPRSRRMAGGGMLQPLKRPETLSEDAASEGPLFQRRAPMNSGRSSTAQRYYGIRLGAESALGRRSLRPSDKDTSSEGNSRRHSRMSHVSASTAEPPKPAVVLADVGHNAATVSANNSLLIVAVDGNGQMPLLHAQRGRISRVYTCDDQAVHKHARVDQLWCFERSIAVQLSSGDVRHYELHADGGGIMNLTELQVDLD